MIDPFRDELVRHIASGKRTTLTVDPTDNGHGTEGFDYTPGISGNGDVWVAMDAIQQNLNSPFTPSTDGNTLFAPTMKGPNGNCLEATVANANGNIFPYGTYGSTTMWFQVYDWCALNGDPNNEGGYGVVAYSSPIDQTFTNNYVRVFSNGDGRPELNVELAQSSVTGRWEALLYNELSQSYQNAYTSASTFATAHQNGWLMFEYYYEVGNTCSSVNVVGAAGNRYYNGTWNLFNQGNAVLGLGYAGNTACFLPSTSDPSEQWYAFQGNPADYGFYVYQQ